MKLPYSAVAAALIGLLLPSLTMAQPDERYWGPGMMWGGGLFHMFNRKAPLPIMRQVQIAAGSLVLLGIRLAVLASPWFMALSAFVGAGLIVAGITGVCGMASLLRHMPWNRSRDVDTSGTPAAAAS
jgi:Protein of unknown function (DUF2892)